MTTVWSSDDAWSDGDLYAGYTDELYDDERECLDPDGCGWPCWGDCYATAD